MSDIAYTTFSADPKFKKYDDKIFYIPLKIGGMYGFDLDDRESFMVTNVHMLSYNFYGDYMYFYKMLDYDDYTVELCRYNTKTKEVSSIYDMSDEE